MPEEVKKRVGEGIVERLNSGPAREEVKRPEWPEGSDARRVLNGQCSHKSVCELLEDWHECALLLERKLAEEKAERETTMGFYGDEVRQLNSMRSERDSLHAQAEALAAAAGSLSDWLQETGHLDVDIAEFNRRANALHVALAAYRAGKTEPTALQKAIPTPERLREMAGAIWRLCEDCDDSSGPDGCDLHGRMVAELRALADALEGKVT